jgi:Rrf2 family protein
MFRLSKKIDYGLIAIRHIALNSVSGQVSAREIAGKNNINYDLTAKILQKLVRAGLIISTQGARGGYVLALPCDKITLDRIIEAIEGPVSLTECHNKMEHTHCESLENCKIRLPLKKIQNDVRQVFTQVTLSEIL